MELPQISGIKLIKILSKKGFMIIRQKGSHIRLQKITPIKIIKLTIPNHKILKKGTLNQIIKDAELTREEIFP